MTYETEDPSSGKWHITGGYGENELFIGQIGVLDISQKDASAVYKKPIKNPAKTNEAHCFEWLTRIDALSQNEVIGMGLGLKSENSVIDEKAFIGMTALDEDTGAFVLVKDGEIKRTAGRFSLSCLEVGKGSYLPTQVVLTYDYSVKIKVGTAECVFANGNTVVELKILGKEISVGFYTQGESADRLYQTVASYVYEEDFVLAKISLISGETLTIDDFKAYNLDTDYLTVKTDYSPEHDAVTPWIEKEGGEESSGCSSAISLVSGLPLLCVATAFVCKKKKERK